MGAGDGGDSWFEVARLVGVWEVMVAMWHVVLSRGVGGEPCSEVASGSG